MKVYFVRHGQTDWNLDKKLQGRTDITLNKNGIKQAQQMRDELASIEFEAILSSPLLRAKQTAEIIAEAHENIPLIVENELIERSFGKYEGKDSRTSDGDYPPYYYDIWSKNFDDNSDTEKIPELEKRIFRFLDRLAFEYKDKTILLVAHGGVGLAISEYFYGAPSNGNMLQYLTQNGQKQVFEINKTSTEDK